MSRSTWQFRPTALRRALQTIKKIGFTPSGVRFCNNDGTFTVLIADPERVAILMPPQQNPTNNEWDTL
jgi:hypothetical protein